MAWELSDDRPIYLQIADILRLRILSGQYPVGSRLPAVRELAAEAAVNPNTMQRALTDLEDEGLVFAQRTSGRFVTEDEGMLNALRRKIARKQLNALLDSMGELGFGAAETAQMLDELAKEREKS